MNGTLGFTNFFAVAYDSMDEDIPYADLLIFSSLDYYGRV